MSFLGLAQIAEEKTSTQVDSHLLLRGYRKRKVKEFLSHFRCTSLLVVIAEISSLSLLLLKVDFVPSHQHRQLSTKGPVRRRAPGCRLVTHP